MIMSRSMGIAALACAALVACAQTPTAPPMPMSGRMAMMDEHMKAMHAMHDKLAKTRTPEERKALMNEHAKLMRDGMAMMDAMGGPQGDMAVRQQMMEKRMDMMQSMMEMMMDRTPTGGDKP
jgi:hypothetical protein